MLFFISIFLILGIAFFVYNPIYLSIILFILLLFLFFKYKRKKKNLLIFISSFLIGISVFTLFQIDNNDYISKYFIVEKSKTNYLIVTNYIKKYYVYNKNNEYETGDILKISGKKEELNFVTLESEFNFQKYLNKNGIKYKINTKEITLVCKNYLNFSSFFERQVENYSSNTKSILQSLLFSNKNYNDDLLYESNELNLISLFSISGFYINIIFSCFYFIFSKKFSDKKSNILSFLCLLPYFIINLFNLKIFRLFLLQFLNFLSKTTKLKVNKLNVIGITNISLILINIYNALSLTVILGLLFSFFSYIINDIVKNKKIITKTILRLFYYFLIFLPVQLYFTFSINITSLFINLLITPYLIIYFIFGFISIFLGYNIFLNKLTEGLNFFISISNKINFTIYHKEYSLLFIIIYYFLIFLTFFIIELKIKKINNFINIFYICSLILILYPYKNLYEKNISFINVGQGDATLIRDKNETVLIDTGGLIYKDVAKNSLINYFKKNQIYDIDYVIITHDDFDHNGCLYSLKQNFKIKNIITNSQSFPLILNNYTIENLNYSKTTDSNDSSLVLKFNFFGDSYLLMGDASKNIENYLIEKKTNLKADYLKVGHHGSNSSSSYNFLKIVDPKEAIISCGKNNIYKHPSDEVIKNLEKLKIKIRRTDIEGSIIYSY